VLHSGKFDDRVAVASDVQNKASLKSGFGYRAPKLKRENKTGRSSKPTFSGFPVSWVRFSVSARCAATEFDRSRPVDSQNGEALGFAKPNLVTLPASRRTFGVAAHRI
jgi:hypothetical protein